MHLPPRRDGELRIGVALPVPEPYGLWLQSLRARLGDPMARRSPAHVTMLGPTVVAQDAFDDVVAHLQSVAHAHAPFVVSLAGPGTFRPVSPVVFARVVAGAHELAALESAVRSGVLAYPTRFDFHPHVTVAHEVPPATLDEAAAALADFAATYVVTSLALYTHADDGVWRTARDVPLSGPRPERDAAVAPEAPTAGPDGPATAPDGRAGAA
ncbi:2'-5' RNA ligase family protein [Georgenia sp. MJ206]|uniref:2'-5' RNA ligase family protein n=1 Tax=Georgenia wangjunii TaxID=3117730 RepID=UPI002F26C1E3